MSSFDLVIRNGTIVRPDEVSRLNIGVKDGQIASLGPELKDSAEQVVDATGLHVFPGLIDSHVHFNDPGRADWEGFFTGTRALAAGGGTAFIDMPLNAHPPTIDADAFDQKLAAARGRALVDFAFWGGLVPDNVDRLEELSERGVVGFKAFMANSGIDDFPCVDARTLRAGMKRAAELKKIVAVHAESETLTRTRTAELTSRNRISISDYLSSRPVEAELEAIRQAIDLAGETGCSLHVVHVSTGAGVALVSAAREQGVDVTCETCPHYLVLTEEDVLSLGAIAKCAPPLRSRSIQDALWRCLEEGKINPIGSDHSPAPPRMKTDANFFKVWGGISGVQHTLPLLLTEGCARRNLNLSTLARVTSFNVAERFSFPPVKGRIEIGSDADFALVDLNQEFEVVKEELFDRHRQSPYAGRRLTGKVVQTILRGQTVCKDGTIASEPIGRLIKPEA